MAYPMPRMNAESVSRASRRKQLTSWEVRRPMRCQRQKSWMRLAAKIVEAVLAREKTDEDAKCVDWPEHVDVVGEFRSLTGPVSMCVDERERESVCVCVCMCVCVCVVVERSRASTQSTRPPVFEYSSAHLLRRLCSLLRSYPRVP